LSKLREKIEEIIFLHRNTDQGEINKATDAILEAFREALPPEATFSKAGVAHGWDAYRTAVLNILEGK